MNVKYFNSQSAVFFDEFPVPEGFKLCEAPAEIEILGKTVLSALIVKETLEGKRYSISFQLSEEIDEETANAICWVLENLSQSIMKDRYLKLKSEGKIQ